MKNDARDSFLEKSIALSGHLWAQLAQNALDAGNRSEAQHLIELAFASFDAAANLFDKSRQENISD